MSGPKNLRPLSQLGLLRIPTNAGNAQRRSGICLDEQNEGFASRKMPKRLHPTKGFRRLNSKSDRAEHLSNLLKHGAPISMRDVARQLRSVTK